jgi:hypothetical protein
MLNTAELKGLEKQLKVLESIANQFKLRSKEYRIIRKAASALMFASMTCPDSFAAWQGPARYMAKLQRATRHR